MIGCTKDVEMMVPLKYQSNCWRTLEMPLRCRNQSSVEMF